MTWRRSWPAGRGLHPHARPDAGPTRAAIRVGPAQRARKRNRLVAGRDMHHAYQSQVGLTGQRASRPSRGSGWGSCRINNGASGGFRARLVPRGPPRCSRASGWDGPRLRFIDGVGGSAAGDSSGESAPGHRNTNQFTWSAAAERPTRSGTRGETPHPGTVIRRSNRPPRCTFGSQAFGGHWHR